MTAKKEHVSKETTMSLRENYYIEEIKKAIQSQKRILNLYGEKGVGKSYIISKMKESVTKEQKKNNKIQFLGGSFDFNNYAGIANDMTINALYDLCDFLLAKKIITLYHFNIADRIDSTRNHRIPYSDRKILSGFDTTSEISEFVSDFIELPYVGAGLKMAKLTAKLAMKYKPKSKDEASLYKKYNALSDEKLREYLPQTLAADINNSLKKQFENIQLLIFIDNFNQTTLNNENTDWLNKLVSDTSSNITWIFASRERIQPVNLPIYSIPISLMSSEETLSFLKDEKEIADESTIECCQNMCGGNPLRIERVLEFISKQQRKGSINWSVLEKQGYEYIALETLKGLSTEYKEILFQLNYANTFDEELFCLLFPGKLFSIYREWFQTSLFTQNEHGKYSVQNSMKEEITLYMNHIDRTLTDECYYNLFKAEQRWFLRQGGYSNATIISVGQHLQSLVIYGRKMKSKEEYFECLMESKNLLIHSGYLKNYLVEMLQIANGDNDYIKLMALKEIASLSIYISDYETARTAIEDGLSLSKEMNDIYSKLDFASIKMNLEYIAPIKDSNAVDACIDIANEYIGILESNVRNIPYRTYISNLVKVNLYLSKEYLIRKDYELSKKCLDFIFDICDDQRKLNALSLYSSLAKAQEQMGELLGTLKEREKSIQMYENAIETYYVAEVLQPFWDAEFYLNFGLVHKRMAEEYFTLSLEDSPNSKEHIQKGIKHLDLALLKYEHVKSKVPEVIDTYCKMGFAYVTAADLLWQDDAWNEVVEKYLEDATDVLEQAIQQISSNVGNKTDGNRQIANSRCIISRTFGLYHERRGNLSKAENYFKQTLKDGEYAILAAPNHPYGYMECANGHLSYSDFLLNRKRNKEAGEIIHVGLKAIEKAESFVNQSAGFVNIRKKLEENLARC